VDFLWESWKSCGKGWKSNRIQSFERKKSKEHSTAMYAKGAKENRKIKNPNEDLKPNQK